MIYYAKPGQVSYGEAVGILAIENYVPFVPGDTANATTYPFPVRFYRMEGVTVDRIFRHDRELYRIIKNAALGLKREGVRAVTSDCGFLALFQEQLAAEVGLPFFMSSLMQIPFAASMLDSGKSVGIITANAASLTDEVLSGAGISDELQQRLLIRGLEDSKAFTDAVVEEKGYIDTELVEKAVVERAEELVSRGGQEKRPLGALLLECSLLPPYAAAVQEAVELPVFDFVTMITYVHSAVVHDRYYGHM